ncbi:MAG: ATP-dependent helicase HrpB [Rhodobacteraceae bacterium]|nr:ATP-dependent helicase HrpB [Paracoccaceae bacterium]
MNSGLPIEAALPELLAALIASNQAVLQAPPGAGKTTRVPLLLLKQKLFSGRILVLEPRRLAARAAAERMAETLGEKPGETVGYRMRGATCAGRDTRIEVITEGILTRLIQSDPELTGVSCIIFDEFHERSLQADLGLALALEIRSALRPDLCLIAMSATLDAEPVADLMGGAPVVTSMGRSFPVEVRHLPQPWAKPGRNSPRYENAMAGLILQAAAETEGGILAFLPGEGEIRRVEALLRGRLAPSVNQRPLYGALPFAEQRKAVLPEAMGRKLVLATSIAETSLTIEDVSVVIDGGRARRARFDAGSGMSRLVTERVTKAEATQRQGRAGRVAEGICYKLWTKGEEGGMAPYPLPEILAADLTGLVLELAAWGTPDPTELSFLDPPRGSDFAAAQELLHALGALDADNRITPHGKRIAKQPVHARLGHMLEMAGSGAVELAAVLENRDILQWGGAPLPTDLSLRLEALKDPGKFEATRPYRINRAALDGVRKDAKRLHARGKQDRSPGEMAALAYPDRIGLRRKGEAPRFLLSGGKGAVFANDDAMGGQRMIVATDLDGDAREARVRMAVPFSEAELQNLYGDRIEDVKFCGWSKRGRCVLARVQSRFGALVLSEQNWKGCPPEATAAGMAEGVRDLGLEALPWNKAARFLQARIEWLRARGTALPDCSDAALTNDIENWLQPHLTGMKRADDLKRLDLTGILRGLLSWEEIQTLDQLAPAAINAPTGTKLAVDYSGEQPKVSVRLQEVFGMTRHPAVGPDHLPLLIELLSPAQRPLQMTADLPGFWATTYNDVRKDMRGRYPKHPWPEDPTVAEPTRRVKRKPPG